MKFYGKTEEPDIPAQDMLLDSETDGSLPENTLSTQKVIGEKEIAEAQKILAEYKDGKQNLEDRIVKDEQWFKEQHWDIIGSRKKNDPQPRPTSAYLFNAIANKHADAMDNEPEPIVLPRERSDEQSAKVLQAILPVVMEYNDFSKTYSDAWWDKLKDGTAAYMVTWDPQKDGIGDIRVSHPDLLKIFWEPGITDIQDSKNLFIVDLIDEEILEAQYPDLKGKLKGNTINVKDYIYDDAVDNSDKSLVVDWYYKVQQDGQIKLHYAKFVGNQPLYASENDPAYQERGFYDHGKYPVVFDTMYPEKGTPVGFGLVAICKDPQMYIDKLSANIMENSMMTTKKRFFVSANTGVNEQEFLDWNNPIVHVEGELGEERIREIITQPLSAVYESILQMKIEEMKDTASNRDVNSGGTGGVSAAAAISALQEAGNKSSRDIIGGTYRAYGEIIELCIELIRQFYDEARSFRITGEQPGSYDFVDVSNLYLKDQVTGQDASGNDLYRKPIFDLKVKAQKKNPFSRMEQNERAKELYSLGFFNPEMAQSALGALEMMDFEGIDKVREFVSNGQTLMNIVQQQQMQLQQMSMMLGAATGIPMQGAAGAEPEAAAGSPPADMPTSAQKEQNPDGKSKVASGIMQANKPMTSYGDRLAKRSAPDMNSGSNKALPK